MLHVSEPQSRYARVASRSWVRRSKPCQCRALSCKELFYYRYLVRSITFVNQQLRPKDGSMLVLAKQHRATTASFPQRTYLSKLSGRKLSSAQCESN
jgi:hypothetical protein